uniref:hypothetical protein n=1 Tax=Tessaracoccus coleopterorum TaxID=2714950 RepID=UPI002F912878
MDLPSGLDADDNRLHRSFRATHTVTFDSPKPCHAQQPASGRCGAVHVIDIGLERDATNLRIAEESDVAAWWPTPMRAPTSTPAAS